MTRVILPNGSTSVVTTTSGESIRALVSRLLEKRGLKIANFEVCSFLIPALQFPDLLIKEFFGCPSINFDTQFTARILGSMAKDFE